MNATGDCRQRGAFWTTQQRTRRSWRQWTSFSAIRPSNQPWLRSRGRSSSYLFCLLVYTNWQWPGAAINLTTDEAAGAVKRMATSLSTAGSIRQYLPMGQLWWYYTQMMLPSSCITGASWGHRMLLLAHQPEAATSFFSTRTTGCWLTIGMPLRVSPVSSTTLHCWQQQQCAKLEPPRWLAPIAIFLHYRGIRRPPNVAAGSSAGGSNFFLLNSHNRLLTNYRDD